MATLPPFSGDKPTCTKCKYPGAATQWVGPNLLGGTVLEEEYLKRSCDRCGFAWREALNEGEPARGDAAAR